MPYKEHKIEKVRWNIGEVADMIDRATSTIRYWESEFPWLTTKKGRDGHRIYNKEKVLAVKDVDMLVNKLGLTMEGVRKAYNSGDIDNLIEIVENR